MGCAVQAVEARAGHGGHLHRGCLAWGVETRSGEEGVHVGWGGSLPGVDIESG